MDSKRMEQVAGFKTNTHLYWMHWVHAEELKTVLRRTGESTSSNLIGQ
jgi:hypothetical protein